MIEQGLQARRSYKLHHEHAMTYKKAYEINLCCVAPRAHTTEFSFEPHHPTRAKSMVRSPDAALGEELYYIVNLTAIRFPTPGQAQWTAGLNATAVQNPLTTLPEAFASAQRVLAAHGALRAVLVDVRSLGRS